MDKSGKRKVGDTEQQEFSDGDNHITSDSPVSETNTRQWTFPQCLGLFNHASHTGDATYFFECITATKSLLPNLKSGTNANNSAANPFEDDLRQLCARAHVQLGKLCSSDGEAAQYFKAALDFDAQVADAHCNYALRIRDSDALGAEKHFRSAINLAAKYIPGNQTAGEEEEEEEELSSFCVEELDAGRIAQYNLSLLLCQKGDHDVEADAHCEALGFKFRLSPAVLAHTHRAQQFVNPKASTTDFNKNNKYCVVHDNALPEPLLRRLQSCFKPDALFWDEHGYHMEPGFFSYYYPLNRAPETVVEQLIQYLANRLQRDLAVRTHEITVDIYIPVPNWQSVI